MARERRNFKTDVSSFRPTFHQFARLNFINFFNNLSDLQSFVCLYRTNSLRPADFVGRPKCRKNFFCWNLIFSMQLSPSGQLLWNSRHFKGYDVFFHIFDNLSDFQISYVCITRIRFASPGRLCWAHEMSEKLFLLESDFFNAVITLRAATLKL